MIALGSSGTIGFLADAASEVNVLVTGEEFSSGGVGTYKTLYQGQAPNSATTEYTAPSGGSALISHIMAYNTDSASHTLTVFIGGTGGTNSVGKVTIPAGQMATFDRDGWKIVPFASGLPGSSIPPGAVLIGGSDGTDLRAISTDSSGREIVVGAAAAGAAVAGNPVLVAGSDGTDARTVATDTSGRQLVQNYRSDGRAWPLGSKLATATPNTSGVTVISAPGAGNHILIKLISLGAGAAEAFIQVNATIGGVATYIMTVIGGQSNSIVDPSGILCDANTAITCISGANSTGAVTVIYDVVT